MPLTQANRAIQIASPLGKDVLLLTGFTGHEAISELFNFQLDCVAENKTDIAFDKLLGQKLTVQLTLANGKKRFFNGLCNRVSQGHRDDHVTTYRLEIVPQLWLLTRKKQSRIFQHENVPAILKKVLEGIDAAFEIQGTFEPRDYCVQYRETDFDFASRLMEEEGIFYFFKHTADGHKMVIANQPQSHPDVPEQNKAVYEELKGGNREENRITSWQKTQELRSGKVTIWDHCFELPHKHLEAEKIIQDDVAVGKVKHKLKVAGNDKLELYDYPGAYAQRFDGIDRGGGVRAGDLQKIFEDNKRTVGIRMQQEAVQGLVIEGQSDCGQLTSGHKFALERHFNADGSYVLTRVEHSAHLPFDFRSTNTAGLSYDNRFSCIPLALPYRPPLVTPKPEIAGTQTAVVVGPPGEKIYPDKYGRVKLQFHWDRQGKNNLDSSCWVGVSQNWGGGNWGGMFIPHVGQEVIVSFEEGDPDRPIVTGRVYNAECMPPLELPANKTKSVLRDHGGNEMIMEGDAGKQQILMYSPTHQTKMTLGNSWNLFTQSDITAENRGNTIWSTIGYWQQKILGNLKIEGGGDILEVFLGMKHDTVVGSRSEITFINKNESTVGLLSEVCGGIKVDIHKGKHFVHQPDEVELTKARRLKKAEAELAKQKEQTDIINKIWSKLNEHEAVIGEVLWKVKFIQFLVTKFRVVADEVELQSKGAIKLNASGDIDAKCGIAAFNCDNMQIEGGLFVGGRIFVVDS